MLLPNAEHAFVDPGKVQDYLLSPDHPEGRSKSRVFAALGYSPYTSGLFVEQLRKIARIGVAVNAGVNRYGRKYSVDGILESSSGKGGVRVRTVWIVQRDEHFPRLITAYPLRRS